MLKKKVYNINFAIERLKNYCALQEKCQWDVIQKIKEWGFSKICQQNILKILIQEGYLDEERYSRSFCRGKFRLKGWGKEKIRNELKKKYISESYIKKGLEEIKDSEYQNELDNQYHKKLNTINETNHFKKKQKIAQYLIRKGFKSNLVWEKLKEIKE